ncbi:MAG: ATP-binding protein [Methanomassiliicoccales archaeon]
MLAVKDNGIGIDSRYQDKLFKMIQRLHTKEECPRHRVAIAKKIVERHDGRIWVESKEGKGATFYFSIPLRERSSRLGYQIVRHSNKIQPHTLK